MKAEETFIIISLLGTMSQAAKLLKVPRIYNAIITSDKELLPSQAFPALSPILQGIHYPHFANALYPLSVNQNPDSFSNEAKNVDKTPYQYYDYAKGVTGAPMNKNMPVIQNTQKQTPSLFMPNFKPKNEKNEDMPNVIPNSNFRNNRPDDMKQFYPHYDNEIGQILNVMNYENKKVYSASSPVSSNRPTDQSIPQRGFPFIFPSLNKPTNPTSQLNGLQNPSNYPQNVQPVENKPNENPPEQPDVYQFPFNYNFIKNNRPKDESIVDVPPPPLPIGNSATQRRDLPINPSPSSYDS